MSDLQIPKLRDRFCSEEFLNYVRSLPCCVCGKASTASHMRSVKFADGSDALAVPACMPDHHVQSTKTSREILERAGIDIQKLHEKLWNGFLRENHIEWQGVVVITQRVFEEALRVHGMVQPPHTTRKNSNWIHRDGREGSR